MAVKVYDRKRWSRPFQLLPGENPEPAEGTIGSDPGLDLVSSPTKSLE